MVVVVGFLVWAWEEEAVAEEEEESFREEEINLPRLLPTDLPPRIFDPRRPFVSRLEELKSSGTPSLKWTRKTRIKTLSRRSEREEREVGVLEVVGGC